MCRQIALSSGDASDSICPKGWGIAKHEGDGSYQKLIMDTYKTNKTSSAIDNEAGYKEYNDIININDSIVWPPILTNLTGYYSRSEGSYINRTRVGFILEKTAYSTERSFIFYFYRTYVRPKGVDYKDNGHTLRCVAK